MFKKLVLIFCLSLASIGSIFITNAACTTDDCVEQPTFTLDTTSLFGDSAIDDGTTTTEQLANKALGTIIQNLMIAMGTISLLIMTIGAGYMIFYNGQDDILSKGKSIFSGGLIALAVALTSYYMVSILRFVLFKGN